MKLRLGLTALILACAQIAPAVAHEFWLDPAEYQVAIGDDIAVDLKNGELFSGVRLAYFPGRTARFQISAGGAQQDVDPRMGDLPALQMQAATDGLLVVVHETVPSELTYAEWEKFAEFAAHKDFPDIRARHLARGLPETDFVESYTRHAKTLIAVGDGAGADRVFGLETEFVALTNPYSDTGNTFRARLEYRGSPRPDAQVEVFARAPDGAVTVSLLRTDDAGEVSVPVAPGHDYLLDAVVLRPASGDGRAVWETLWAALTFARP